MNDNVSYLRDVIIPVLPTTGAVTTVDFILVENNSGTGIVGLNADVVELLNNGMTGLGVATTSQAGITRLANDREVIVGNPPGLNAAVVVQSNDSRLKPVTITGPGLIPQLPNDNKSYFWGDGQWRRLDNISESQLDSQLQSIINGDGLGYLNQYDSIKTNTTYSSGSFFDRGGFVMGYFNSAHANQFEVTVQVNGRNIQYVRAPLGSLSSRMQVCVPKPPNTSFRISTSGISDNTTFFFASFV